jgi:hypothetical protein
MTHEQRAERLQVLAHELAALLAEEPGAPKPPVRIISGNSLPSWVRAWLLEQIRRSDTLH